MDAQRFDDLARKLVNGTSRRGVLKGIAAGIGASVFGFSHRQSASALTVVITPCTTAEDCDEGEICSEGFCAADNAECAQIDAACGAEIECCQGTCVGGFCAPPCIAEGANCGENPESCCGDLVCAEGVCAAGTSCAAEGELCGEIPCCGDELTCFQTVCSIVTCSEEGDPCSEIACCTGTGLICNDKGYCETPKEYCGVPGDECEIPDHNCCSGLTCFEGLCDNPSGLCMDEWEYCDGKNFTCCKGLDCGSDYFCHPAKQAGGGAGPVVTALPSTGSGSEDDNASWINAAALGGGAAVLGAAYLRAKGTEKGYESGT